MLNPSNLKSHLLVGSYRKLLEERGLSKLWLEIGPSAELGAIAFACRGYSLGDLLVIQIVYAIVCGGSGPSLAELLLLGREEPNMRGLIQELIQADDDAK